jgi:hypothetical protein
MDVFVDVLIVVLLLAAWFATVVGLAKSEARKVRRAGYAAQPAKGEDQRLDE